MTYHGKPADFSAKFCFADMGNVELEIIQPISGKSVWFDFLEKHGEGIHHIKFLVSGLQETKQYLNKYNLPIHPNYAMLGGGRYDRNNLRVDCLAGTQGNGMGRNEWEKEYYQDIVNRGISRNGYTV